MSNLHSFYKKIEINVVKLSLLWTVVKCGFLHIWRLLVFCILLPYALLFKSYCQYGSDLLPWMCGYREIKRYPIWRRSLKAEILSSFNSV